MENLHTFSEYEALALRTASKEGDTPAIARVRFALGFVGEVGELVDGIKKVRCHGHPFDRAAFVKECGDVLWYITALCNSVDDSPLVNLTYCTETGNPCPVLNEYTARELRGKSTGSKADDIEYYALCLANEAGVFAGLVTSAWEDSGDGTTGSPLGADATDSLTSLGAALWSLVHILVCVNVTLSEVATANIAKLQARYPIMYLKERVWMCIAAQTT